MKRYTGIYYLYQILYPNGKRYIGVTSEPKVRWQNHLSGARLGYQSRNYDALRKFGDASQFQVLVVGKKNYILKLEVLTIALYKTQQEEYGYNIRKGGHCSPVEGIGHSEVTRKKMSLSQKKRKRRPEELARMRDVALARKITPEYKEKLKQAAIIRWSRPGARESQRQTLKTKANLSGLQQWNARYK